VEELLHLFTARLRERPRNVAQLARLVLDTASEGDGTAGRIVAEHGALLGDYALAAARKVGIADTPFPLVLVGGLFRHPSRMLATSLLERVKAGAPAAWLLESRSEPVAGALLLALEEVGVLIEQRLLDRLAASTPPAPFFAT
jgi:N-acetylglucosamine kinase-like BadF-type ATPase